MGTALLLKKKADNSPYKSEIQGFQFHLPPPSLPFGRVGGALEGKKNAKSGVMRTSAFSEVALSPCHVPRSIPYVLGGGWVVSMLFWWCDAAEVFWGRNRYKTYRVFVWAPASSRCFRLGGGCQTCGLDAGPNGGWRGRPLDANETAEVGGSNLLFANVDLTLEL